jgi:hypothetical protein
MTSKPSPSGLKRKRGGQPGNRNSYKHGFYANNFSCDERRNLTHNPDLESEMKAMRVIANRMLARILSYGLGSEDEGVIDKSTLNAINVLNYTFTTIANMSRSYQLILGEYKPLEIAILTALHEVSEKDGWDNV